MVYYFAISRYNFFLNQFSLTMDFWVWSVLNWVQSSKMAASLGHQPSCLKVARTAWNDSGRLSRISAMTFELSRMIRVFGGFMAPKEMQGLTLVQVELLRRECRCDDEDK